MAEAAGVSHFMTKPFSNTEMLEVVRRLAMQSPDTHPDNSPDTSHG